MALRMLSESTVLPVTIAEVKLHLRLSTSDTTEDSLLTGLIKAAEAKGENITKRGFIPQTWRLTLDGFPSGGISLPRAAPLSTASTNLVIAYRDSTGGTSILGSTAYTVDDESEPAFIVPSSDNDWPDIDDVINAVKVEYVCGYPLNTASAAAPPDAIKQWMLLQVGAMYENRESIAVMGRNESVGEYPRSFIDGLLDPYVIIEV